MNDLTGSSLAGAIVLRRADGAARNASWVCRMSCGHEEVREGIYLRFEAKSGRIPICRQGRKTNGNTRVHGETVLNKTSNRKSKEYSTWVRMRGRCNNERDAAYKYYGGRGLRVAAAWEASFEAFLRDVGRAPTPQHTLEREDNSKGYEPGNCVWATRLEQQQNLRSNHNVEAFGAIRTLSAWARDSGLAMGTLGYRLRALRLPAEVAIVLEPKRKSERPCDFQTRVADLVHAHRQLKKVSGIAKGADL